jgi:hypothetical protein
LASLNTAQTDEQRKFLKEQYEQWKDKIFALNVSLNGRTDIKNFKEIELRHFIPKEQIGTEVGLRALFSL